MQGINPATDSPLRTLLRSLFDGKENAQSAAAVTLEKAFSSLERGDTDKCAHAAELFAGAATNGLVDEYALPILLSCIPEGVKRGALYVYLARAMTAEHVDAKSWHFQFLLDAACDDEHLGSEHALALLNACSEHFAAHHVTYVDAWDKLHALLAKIWAEPQVEALGTLVRAAHAAGIAGAERWVEVVEKAMKAMPSAEEAKRSTKTRVAAFDDALVLEIDQLRDNDKLSAADALHLLELRAKHHPALFVSEGCCELILRLGRLVLGPGETLPPAFAVLGPQALIHLPSPSKVLEWFKLLATGDPVLPMHVLETMAKELSNKIWLDHTAPNAPGHGKWTLDDLVKLERVLGKPICSLDAWIAVADSQISNRPWIAVEISGQQWHASTSMLTRSIPLAPTDEQKFLQLRILQRKLNIALQNADEGHIRLDAKKLQKVAFLCCALGGDDKCVALLKAIAKRVCEVLMQVQGDDEGLRLMESFFAADEWPFLRALFEEHAPAQWDTLQVCAGGWMEAQYLAANAGKTPQVELKFLERIIAPRSPQWLCDIRSAHSGATAWATAASGSMPRCFA